MSDFQKSLAQNAAQARLVWLSHPYPAGGEVYDFLAKKETLAAVKQVGGSLYIAADRGYNVIAEHFADRQIPPEALPQAITYWQAEERRASPNLHLDPIPPASMARLMVNARAAGVNLNFIGQSSLYELDDEHMKPWLENIHGQQQNFFYGIPEPPEI